MAWSNLVGKGALVAQRRASNPMCVEKRRGPGPAPQFGAASSTSRSTIEMVDAGSAGCLLHFAGDNATIDDGITQFGVLSG